MRKKPVCLITHLHTQSVCKICIFMQTLVEWVFIHNRIQQKKKKQKKKQKSSAFLYQKAQ